MTLREKLHRAICDYGWATRNASGGLVSEKAEALSPLLDQVDQLERANTWQPIETAPKDGTIVDLWAYLSGLDIYRRVADASWCDDSGSWVVGKELGFEVEILGTPKLWMPLPTPPEAQ